MHCSSWASLPFSIHSLQAIAVARKACAPLISHQGRSMQHWRVNIGCSKVSTGRSPLRLESSIRLEMPIAARDPNANVCFKAISYVHSAWQRCRCKTDDGSRARLNNSGVVRYAVPGSTPRPVVPLHGHSCPGERTIPLIAVNRHTEHCATEDNRALDAATSKMEWRPQE